MDPSLLKILLGLAVLLPLISFWVILLAGPRLGKQAWFVATGAIGAAGLLSFASLGIWLYNHFPAPLETHEAHATEEHGSGENGAGEHGGAHDADHSAPAHAVTPPTAYTGDYYLLGQFGKLRLTISYYIDSLTICMFCMVTLIATCIHVYAGGYMHDELHEIEDHEVHTEHGHLHRPGRFHRFFQYLSLFCFSMLGLVLAGNIAMVFCFWELVGICSYFLIGFYIERKSASTAANKAFIVNRVGDFGMIIGLMSLWAGLGTFAFGDIDRDGDKVISAEEQGMFSIVRNPENGYQIQTPDGFVKFAARNEAAEYVRVMGPDASEAEIDGAIINQIDRWRAPSKERKGGYGYLLLVIAGIGIFCGCVGKSAQFPLHTWLPDAMEGPTPVSALVHSATMVAAGVYLVGRFYPVFTPEVLLVIASIGAITLFLAATIAITATDIKRVLAYSTISQLGYMMLALGLGGWVAGLMHLVTHAFFKSLLFLCSGSVIHAVHTNEMTKMGGLRKKMPVTAYTMLVGCLAIAGAGIPFIIGLSGYYSKDAILEQAYSFLGRNSAFGAIFFCTAAGGAAITAFYMFRLWFMTFAGEPRDHHKYDHAHESPKSMYVPLIVLSVFAVSVAWPFFPLSLASLLEQARPAGTLVDTHGVLTNMVWPNEHSSHDLAIKVPVTLLAFGTALGGIALAAAFYGFKALNPEDARRQFAPIYSLLVHKWYFDEIYDFLFVRPVLFLGRAVAGFDRTYIDGFIDGLARVTKRFSSIFEWWADQTIVDGTVNLFASWMYSLGLSLRGAQTGRIRQYVMFIVVGAVGIFILISFFWSSSLAR